MLQIFPHGIMVWKGRRLGCWRGRLDHSGLMPSSSLKSADSWEEQRRLRSGSAMIRESHKLPPACPPWLRRALWLCGSRSHRPGERWKNQRRSHWFWPRSRGTGRKTGETVSFGSGSGVQKAGHGLITQQTEKPESCCVHWSSAKTSLRGERKEERRYTSNFCFHHFGLVLWTNTGGRTPSNCLLGSKSVVVYWYTLRHRTKSVYVSKKEGKK